MCVLLLEAEIKHNFKNKNIAILKSYIENFLLMFSFNKVEMYGLLNPLIEFVKEQFNYKPKNQNLIENLKNNRHSLIKDRIIYSTTLGKVTGDVSKVSEWITEISYLLDEVLKEYLDKDYATIYYSENNELFNVFHYLINETNTSVFYYKLDRFSEIANKYKNNWK